MSNLATPMLRLFLYLFLSSTCFASPLVLHSDAQPINQIPLHKNGCGPVSLLNSHRFSSIEWRARTASFRASPEKSFRYLTSLFGHKISPYVYGSMRWNEYTGMQALDLRDLANHVHQRSQLPTVALDSLFLIENENHESLLKRTQARMQQSLTNGFPPILCLSRFAKIQSNNGGCRWRQVSSHFVSIIAVAPTERTSALLIAYIDPWGGRQCEGKISLPQSTFYASDLSNRQDKSLRKTPCLVALFPHTSVGLHQLSPATQSVLTPTQLIYAKMPPRPEAFKKKSE